MCKCNFYWSGSLGSTHTLHASNIIICLVTDTHQTQVGQVLIVLSETSRVYVVMVTDQRADSHTTLLATKQE